MILADVQECQYALEPPKEPTLSHFLHNLMVSSNTLHTSHCLTSDLNLVHQFSDVHDSPTYFDALQV